MVGLTLSMLVTPPASGAEKPRGIHIGTVSPDILGLSIQAGHVEYGHQVPYKPDPADKRKDTEKDRWVMKDGRFYGFLVGEKADILYTPDRVVGEKLDTSLADRPQSYMITSPDDPAYRKGLAPVQVSRKTKPSDFARAGIWQMEASLKHVIYLHLPKPLKAGRQYTVSFSGGFLTEQTLTWNPLRIRSEAVHVSHLGFRPDDPAKVAFLSCRLGSGGPLKYKAGLTFRVVKDKTGEVVHEGKTALSKAASDKTEDAYNRNYNGTDVFEMDFSSLEKPGTYRVCVKGVGCSYPFEIAKDVWRKAFTVSARGFYHQRSGISLGPPYTSFKRRRSFHPDDGVKIYHSETPLMDTGGGLGGEDSNFGNLNKGRTDEIVPDAWGGYMDAGDWDRRIQHLIVSRLLLELAELFPTYFSRLSLNIPKSRDGPPDIVSEALFNLDCYRRMQTPEGGIRGGIESAEHPRHGEGSWQESLVIMAYAPGVWSSYLYAGVAAQAARWLKSRKPNRANTYRESALRAMNWAEAELPARKDRSDPHAVHDARNLAAAELFRLTGDDRWHELFLKTTAFADPKAELFVWKKHEQRHAAWVYLRTQQAGADDKIRANCLAALKREAEERLDSIKRTGFRWSKYAWVPIGWGGLSSPDGLSLVRAHVLTGAPQYLRGIVLACQTGAGANPINICYTTGLGHKSPLHPLHIDSRVTHQPPPPGLTVFGPGDVQREKDSWASKLVQNFCFPPIEEWPTLEAYWDVFWYPSICEFTVQKPMAQNAYVWGYLAARK